MKLISRDFLRQFFRYVIVGGVCTLIDFAILFVLTHFMGINYLISSIVSFMSGTVLNYFLCTFWIFKIRIINNKYYEFLYYLIITGVGLLINTGVIWSLTELLFFHYMASKAVAASVTFGWNFGARKYFLHTIK